MWRFELHGAQMAVGKYWRRYKAGGFLAAAICSLAALQIYMAHQHTASSTRVAGVGGRLHALWSRYKDRNLTMPKLPKFFAASPLRQVFPLSPCVSSSSPHSINQSTQLHPIRHVFERKKRESERECVCVHVMMYTYKCTEVCMDEGEGEWGRCGHVLRWEGK